MKNSDVEEVGPIAVLVEQLLRADNVAARELLELVEGRHDVGLHLYAGSHGTLEDERHVIAHETDPDFAAAIWRGKRMLGIDIYDGPKVKVDYLGGDSSSLGIQFELETEEADGNTSDRKPIVINLGMGIRQGARLICNMMEAYMDFINQHSAEDIKTLMDEDGSE